MINNTNKVLVSIASIHSVAQSDKLHTSHIYIFAGFTLNHKNATRDHTILIQNVDNRKSH
jgi:hypothetical protein